MGTRAVTPIERAFFGPGPQARIDDWLAEVVQARLGTALREIAFRSGRIDLVYGLRTGDGRSVVLKVHRPPVEPAELEARLVAVRHLVAAGYPAPQPLLRPFRQGAHVVTVEAMLDAGTTPDARRPAIRRVLAASLVEHVELLRAVAHLGPSLGPGPAWTRYDAGPWPVPHDPVFDFRRTPAGFDWLDTFAATAAEELRSMVDVGAPAIGHGDWYAGNIRIDGERVVAVFDWDLTARPEAVLAGLPASAYLAEGTPAADQAQAFIADVDDARAGSFSRAQWRAAGAAARWVLAFNARCELSNAGNRDHLPLDDQAPTSALGRLRDDRAGFERLGA